MRWRIGILAILLIGCDDPYTYPSAGSSDPLRVMTDRAYYSTNDPIQIVMVNETAESVGFDRYRGTIYWIRDKWTDSGWVEWGSTGLYASYVPEHWVMLPGQTYTDTIPVRKPGMYRFRFPVWKNDDSTQSVMLVSTAFEIH